MANLFEPYKAEISAAVFPHLCAFKKVICEAKFRSFRVRQQYPEVFEIMYKVAAILRIRGSALVTTDFVG